MNIIPTNLNAIIRIDKKEETPTKKANDGFIIPIDTIVNKTPAGTLIAVSGDCTDEVIKNAVGKKILFRIDTDVKIPETDDLAIVSIDNIVAIID